MQESGGKSYFIFEILKSEVQITNYFDIFSADSIWSGSYGVAQLHLSGNQVHLIGNI